MKRKRPEPKRGEIYQHFNGEYYKIVCVGHHSETGQRMVVYYAIDVYPIEPSISPLDRFMSEVDHEKYPNVKQKYRFKRDRYLNLMFKL